MFIYKNTLEQFNKDVDRGLIAEIVAKKMHEHHIGVGSSQEGAIDRSLSQLSLVLSPMYFEQNINCAIEYQLNSQGHGRIDFMMSGYDENNKNNIVIIELKQWSYENVELIDDSDNLRALVARNVVKEKNHPSDQSLGYARTFELYYDICTRNLCNVYPCSYLHNYIEGDPKVITNKKYESLLIESPSFLKHDNDEFRKFIKRYIHKSDNGKIFEQLENSTIQLSKQARENAKDLIMNNSNLVLLDEQKIAYNAIKRAIKDAITKNQKTTFVIKGGAGTGKSIIALKLVGELLAAGKKAFYLTHNSAPRYAFIDAIKKAEKEEHKVNTGTTSFVQWAGNWVRYDRKTNELDLLVVDEAHRLQTSVQGARAHGLTITGEIIKSSKVSVFFMDERQFVHKQDKGTTENIKNEAAKWHSEFVCKTDYDLHTQFRCGGSDGYIAYIENILYGDPIDAPVWLKDFELKFFKDPTAMMDSLRKLNDNGIKSRMLAGYCYDWNHGNDVTIGNFAHPWNEKTDSWATKPNTFEEIGCVYSCQGLEFDYVGVIIGKDMKYQNGKIEFFPENHAKSDTSSDIYKKGFKDKDSAIELIKNHYYVLLTRGVKGCYIYCEDDKLREYLENKFKEYQEMLMD